jgi:hypothetical protein
VAMAAAEGQQDVVMKGQGAAWGALSSTGRLRGGCVDGGLTRDVLCQACVLQDCRSSRGAAGEQLGPPCRVALAVLLPPTRAYLRNMQCSRV